MILIIFLLALFLPGYPTFAQAPACQAAKVACQGKPNAQAQPPQELTIQKAVSLALTHRPDLKALSYAVQANKSGAKSLISGYYPTIALGSDISQQTGQTTLGSQTSVGVNQLVYSFAGPQQQYQKAKKITELSELDKVTQSNQIRLETEKAFLQTWLIQEQERTIDALKTSAQTTYQKQKHKNKLEQLDKDIWLKSAQEYAASTVQVDQYQDTLDIELKRLEFFMGESLSLATTHLAWENKKKYSLKPLSTYYHYALTTRPEIPQGLKRIAIEKWNIKLAQGARLPIITANAQAGCQVIPANTAVTTPTSIPDVEFSTRRNATIDEFWSIGVSFRWMLFDGLVTQYQEQQAQANKAREMLDREQTILRIKQEVHEKYFELGKAIKRLKAQKASYRYQENSFKLVQQKFDLDKIAKDDFDQAATSWQQAQLDWLKYNTTVALAERELVAACGYPKDLD